MTRPAAVILTLWQPYATLAALGHKVHETRGRASHYRGPVFVAAGMAWHRRQRELWDECSALLVAHGRAPLPCRPVLGKILAVVDQVDCRLAIDAAPRDALDAAFGLWGPGRHAYRWGNPRPLAEPIAWRGVLGFRDAPPEVVREVLKQATFGPGKEQHLPLFDGRDE